MSYSDFSHWDALWRKLGARGDSAIWHRRIRAAYTASSRHYHSLRHLEECLAELAAHSSLAKHPARVETALWFHDAIYDSHSATNEEDSAALAVECLAAAGVEAEAAAAIRRLVLVTKTHEAGDDTDAALLIDIDLAILGQPAERFWDYEQGIRKEYEWVPAKVFAQKRAEILEKFLQRPVIYRTEAFRARYEEAARRNLRSAIARLTAKPGGGGL